MGEFYNDAIKKEYLKRFENEGTQNTIKYIFLASKSAEEDVLKKDLYNFSRDEIEEVLKNMSFKVPQTARANTQQIKQYIRWAIKSGYRDNNDNPLNGITKDYYMRFVDRTKKIHFSFDEFFSPNGILESLANAQDQCFLSMMWMGAVGQRFSELQQLHYNHINWNTNEIKIHNEKGEYDRTIVVSDQIMRYIKNAYNQTHYKTYVPETGEFNERELVKTDYIFQNTKSPRVKDGEPVSLAVFYNRMNNIRAENITELQDITPNSCKQSGMIYLAYKLLVDKIEKGGEPKLTYDEIKVIGEKYNFAKFNNNGHLYYNSTLMKEFVNETTVKDLYNLDITV